MISIWLDLCATDAQQRGDAIGVDPLVENR
jgi:hypothetical protein